MGIFSKKEAEVSLPDLRFMSLPDSKYIHKHLGDVGALLEAMQIRREKPELQEAGARLAALLIVGFPGDGSASEVVEQGMAAAATRGFGLASLYAPSSSTSKAMHEALHWAGYITLPEAMRPVASAHVFALHAGHFIGHYGDDAIHLVLAKMDWPTALKHSPTVAVMSDTTSQAWAALCGRG